MENLLKNYNLSLTLLVLFLASWVGQGYFQWQEFAHTQHAHNQPVTMEEFSPEFFSRTFENWQSEFLQLLAFVVLTSFLIHRGSPESKDGDEEMRAQLARIERKLNAKQ